MGAELSPPRDPIQAAPGCRQTWAVGKLLALNLDSAISGALSLGFLICVVVQQPLTPHKCENAGERACQMASAASGIPLALGSQAPPTHASPAKAGSVPGLHALFPHSWPWALCP